MVQVEDDLSRGKPWSSISIGQSNRVQQWCKPCMMGELKPWGGQGDSRDGDIASRKRKG